MGKKKLIYVFRLLITLLSMTLISFFFDISLNVAYYDDHGINPTGSQNLFFGIAIVLSVCTLLVCLITLHFIKKEHNR